MIARTQPWIFSLRFDTAFILSPAILVTAIIIVFHGGFSSLKDVPPWIWLLLIVGVDVSHVYSTLFRTYLDREEIKARQALYILTPLLSWLVGCFLYSFGSLVFWRVLTYLAVFHFVRQQYGLMMIYARRERGGPGYCRMIDKAAIYMATIYPLVYWHCHARNFDWFVQGDFVSFNLPGLSAAIGILYAGILVAYSVKETLTWKRSGVFNIPKNLLLAGTVFSWFIGIVAFNNDLAFTATNVIAHGIPYMALIWAYGHNQVALQRRQNVSWVFSRIAALFSWKTVPFYIATLFLLAFLEEDIWDGFVWREHGEIFGFSTAFPAIQSQQTLVWLVPLLALPQATHYVLDAFIWRLNLSGTSWKQILFYQTSGEVNP